MDRQAITGTVTFNGAPLDQGAINFVPEGPSKGTASGAVISEGKFTVPAESGLSPGAYRVSITSVEPSKPRSPDEMMNNPEPAHPERIPENYNLKSELKAEVVRGKNEFSFKLTGTAPPTSPAAPTPEPAPKEDAAPQP